MSKYQFGESDIYLPGTDLPVNRIGVDDPDLLHEIESQLLEEGYGTFIGELSAENGRITRMFFDLIAIANGYAPIDYRTALSDEQGGQNRYIRASIACVQLADSRALQQIILAGLKRVATAT